jgi:hypothetical protein
MVSYNNCMKCLSIQQPYADAIMEGVKLIEYRSWNTSFRGRFAVHASSFINKDSALWHPSKKYLTSVVLGTVELTDVRDVSDSEGCPAFEWMLRYPLHTEKPLRMKGKLRLFDLPTDICIRMTVA